MVFANARREVIRCDIIMYISALKDLCIHIYFEFIKKVRIASCLGPCHMYIQPTYRACLYTYHRS